MATQRARARVGTLLNEKWRIDSLLGIGGMAAVYGATHRNGKRAALKMLHAELVADPALVTRFLREGYLANKVEHAGVVSVLDDAYAEDGSPYLVMELLEGYSLERHTQSPANALPLRQVLKIADDLLDVLAAAHAKGLVHRDIKPANLFLTRDGKVKVLDFGIARLAETSAEGGLTQTGAAIGTPSYMPPEQARGRWTEVDARTDLWAVGATMLALLLGQRPRRADTVQEELFVAMTAPMPATTSMLPEVPERIALAIDRAVAFERDARFADAPTMQVELRRAAEGADSVALDHTLVVQPSGDTAPVMHPGIPLSTGGSHGSGIRATGNQSSPSYGSTVQMSEPQLTTGRPMWVASEPTGASPSRRAAPVIATVAAVFLLAIGLAGTFVWKRHRDASIASQPPSPTTPIVTAAPVAPAPAPAPVPVPDPVAATSAAAPPPDSAASAVAAEPPPSSSASLHAAAPRASTTPRATPATRSSGAPADTSSLFDRRF